MEEDRDAGGVQLSRSVEKTASITATVMKMHVLPSIARERA